MHKACTPYSQAELRRFVLETGRTAGVLQADPEPALLAIATSVTGEAGGLSFRKTPVGWKQGQGSVGSMQATLYGQIKALRLEILECYDVDLSVHSALFTWLVRHAQWLVSVTFATQKERQLSNGAGVRSMPALSATLALEKLYFSASRIRRRVVQLLCLEFGWARTQSRISTLLLTVPACSRRAVSSATPPPGKLTLHFCSL